jgi:hypothetical protein
MKPTTSGFEFTLICIGYGENVEQAFQNLLEQLKEDPEKTITNEVVYVVKSPCILEEPVSGEFDEN